jgi:rare lipoprotein A
MKKFVMSCAVAGLIALSPKSEARLSDNVAPSPPTVAPQEKEETGVASWYGQEFQGSTTANGEAFDPNGLTAAHPTLPFGTTIRVTNLKNNKNILLRVNDRGPYFARRILDVSLAAANRLGFVGAGTTQVRVEVVKYPKAFLLPSLAKAAF